MVGRSACDPKATFEIPDQSDKNAAKECPLSPMSRSSDHVNLNAQDVETSPRIHLAPEAVYVSQLNFSVWESRLNQGVQVMLKVLVPLERKLRNEVIHSEIFV
jgi:hypothetical protein